MTPEVCNHKPVGRTNQSEHDDCHWECEYCTQPLDIDEEGNFITF